MNNIKKILGSGFVLMGGFLAAVFFISYFFASSYVDADLGWHLQIGKDIYEQKEAPSIEKYYNNDLSGQEWVDHEWLFNLVFYFLFSKFGFVGLNFFFSFLLVIQFIFLKKFIQNFFIFRHTKLSDSLTAMSLIIPLSLYGLYASSSFLGSRMQILGNLFFLLLLYLLYHYKLHKEKKVLFLLPLLFIFWANLHGSFMIGLITLWGFVFYTWIETFLNKISFLNFFYFNPKSLNYKATLSFFALLASISTLINPYGYKLYSLLSSYGNNYYQGVLAEWLPFYFFPIQYHQLIYMAIFVVVIILLCCSVRGSLYGYKSYLRNTDPIVLALALFLLIMSLKSKRHFPLFFIASLPYMVQFFYFEFLDDFKTLGIKKIKIELRILASLGLILLATSLAYNSHYVKNPFLSSYSSVPYGLINFLKENDKLKDLKMLNDYRLGSHIVYSLNDWKVFIDGRMPQIDYRYHSLIEEYHEFFSVHFSKTKLEEENIGLLILEKENIDSPSKLERSLLTKNYSQQKADPLLDFVSQSEEWEKIYEDKQVYVFIKKEI